MHPLSDLDARRLLLFTPQVSAIATLGGTFEWVNPALTEALGWSFEELTTRPFFDYIHPEDHAATLSELARLADGEVARSFLVRMKRKQGGWSWLDWTGRPSPDGRIFAAARVLEERTNESIALRSRVEQLQMAESMANVGTWRLDLQADRPTWSRQVYRIHGRDPALPEPTTEEAIGYYHPEDRPLLERTLGHTIETGEPFHFEMRIIRDDGEVRLVESRGAVERDTEGQTVALVGAFQDITEAAKVARRGQHIDRLTTISNLARGVAHEVNNPLTYVAFNAETLVEELQALEGEPAADDRAMLVEMARDIHEGAARIARIVDSLRTFSIQPGDVALHPVALTDAVAAALAQTAPVWRPRVVPEVDLPDDLPAVSAQHAPLVQVIDHLIRNAAQASAPADGALPPLRISAEAHKDGTVVLSISDEGAGMTPEVLARAFQPFFSTRRAENAIGLGLFVAQSYAGTLGGDLTLDSRPGEGTVAHLRLTADVRPAKAGGGRAPRTLDAAAGTASRPARVLVLDDEPRVGRAVARVLSEHTVTLMTNGHVALAHLEKHPEYDIIFTDLTMPEMSGAEFFARLPPALQDRCWVLTGAAMDDANRAFRTTMGARVLDKPVDKNRLRRVVAEAAARS